MATGMASAGAAAALDTLLGTSANRFVQLHTDEPGAAGTTNVATETDRATTQFAAASGGAKATNADADWTAVAATEEYTHFTIWSAGSGGTFQYSGTVTGGSVTLGNDFQIASGDLTCNITPAS